jgi:hypothetical protein
LIGRLFKELGIQVFLYAAVVVLVLGLIAFTSNTNSYLQAGTFLICTSAMCFISWVFVRQVVKGWRKRKDRGLDKLNTLYLVCGGIVIVIFGGLAFLFLREFYDYLRYSFS